MDWDHKVDVLVVGAGGGGMVAAARSADLGGKVLCVEKSASFGGTTALSGGCFWVPNHGLPSRAQKDTPDQARRYLKALTKGEVKDEIIDAYLRKGPAMLRFLQEESELELSCCDLYADYYPEVDGGWPVGERSNVSAMMANAWEAIGLACDHPRV